MLEMLRRQTQTRRRAMRSTTNHACGLYPAVGAASMDPRGVIIGREAYSGKAYIYDPFVLYNPKARVRLASGHALILGKSGFGKSALEKTYVLRQLRFRDRSFCVLDAQGEDGAGEWDSIARQLGITPIRLVYGDADGTQGVRINPLDNRIPAEHQFKVLVSMMEIIAGTLSSQTKFALAEAHKAAAVIARSEQRVVILSDVLNALTGPESALLGQQPVTPAELVEWGQPAALALDELCNPNRDLSGLFDGPTSEGIDLDARLIVFDLTRLPREGEAMPLLMAVLGPWLRFGWIKSGDSIKRTLIVEEAWHILSHRPVARLFEELVRYGRRLGLSFWAVLHHLGDLLLEEAPEAAAILKLTATRVLYHMDRDEAEITANYLGLPDWARYALVDGSNVCAPGRGIWQVGSRINLVEHIRTATEIRLTDTNRRMTEGATDDSAMNSAPMMRLQKGAAA
ncbi:ATP/GTP-binding protein [Streptomyces hygroscopicus]|uniref:ATP/GTP-binding protein n=1 Tax=Streptomyces hygroscopicus TaxID=1912 RepID=UPI001FCC7386|nr:ATP/GTP-binding protein [Streptomyces hygroscopicus]BDH10472.1 ATP/GTP-binding protein [Streptomyces hygroscopicus]